MTIDSAGERLNSAAADRAEFRLALDIGTEYVKALVVVCGERPEVLGVGRVRQRHGHMEGGAIADIGGVVDACRAAIEEACVMAGVRPKGCVTGLAGEFVVGAVVVERSRRALASKSLKEGELRALARRAQRRAVKEAQSMLAKHSGLGRIGIAPVSTQIVQVKIDGYRVTSPLEFRGRHVELHVFTTYAPLVHVGAIKSVVRRLGLRLEGLVADPWAVADAAVPPAERELGGIVVDIGGGSTDLALLKQGAVQGTQMIAIGGRAFTKGLAERLGLDFQEAETLKLEYADGVLGSAQAARVREALQDDLQVLADALGMALDAWTSADGQAPPPRVYLCGGGSGLPGVSDLFTRGPLAERFGRRVLVRSLSPRDVTGMDDPRSLLSSARDVTPKCLARHAVRLGVAWPAGEGR